MFSYRSRTTTGLHSSWAAVGTMIILASSALLAEAAEVVTVELLLGRMTDTRWLATPPQAGERTVQFSSYDRASRLVDGKIVNPFANGDRGHYLRVEGEGKDREWVLAEAQGPGYVSRIWSANPDGELRIYVDESKTPALAAPFAAITNGEVKPFEAPFGHDASRGRNLYFPFPFAKSIKISTTKGDQYFQVSVTNLPAETQVESYSPEVLKRATRVVEQTRRTLLRSELREPDPQARVMIAAGQSADLVPASWARGRPGALTRLVCEVKAANVEDALARTLLTITFDGASKPQVAVPLGEFFGSGPGLNPFRSAINRVRDDGLMVANWYMPYRESVRVRLTNFTDETITYSGGANAAVNPPVDEFLYFHARWRYQDNLQTRKANGTLDWPALRVSGASGRFVGLLLNVFNPTPAWWGEGDEKIYVDGESFPSTFGTGTEDYFGYAWSDNHTYMNPFHAQTRCDGPGTKGNSSNIRYQILDSVPFQKSLNFDLEVWHWEAVKVQYATIAYFYAAPGASIEPDTPDLSTRKVYPKPPIKREPGVIEGEDLKVKAKTAGDVPNQDMTPFGDAWSGASQLWWVGGAPRERLDLELPFQKTGTYAISAAFTKAGDYGTVQLSLDHKPLGDPIDLYAPFPSVLHTGPILLGNMMLDEGHPTLSITVTGKNLKSSNYLVGLDWIKLTPAPTGSFPGRNESGNRR